ncbi:MAG TPA: MFS transporter [Syntrophorhabdaceae bacterium]|nr:MFS transporter [Syntrophorhabdaceae bacterium]HOL05207.1 MFS transporter [Syntrophorhabdaceae bacterium]HON84790.1 MFS transporter [Syntrophorhabdaceae bacterium]HOT41822.1 MFS transporter [Syntrophorhabdaceae bacterium]HPC66368.1 MFS transporter [Syntrophorhabdaceae bacterium]
MKKAVPIFLTLASLFCLSMFYRSSNAVIALELIRDLHLNAETIGFLGGAFFYSFSLLQIPMGLLLDRIGPKIIMSSFALIGALGSFLFAFSNSFYAALVGRVFIGIGMATMLMGSLKVLTLRFPPERFATLAGLMITAGAIGSLLSASPLAFFSSLLGWRATFIVTGVITVFLGITLFFLLGGRRKEVESLEQGNVSKEHQKAKNYIKVILSSHAFWQICVMAFFRYGTFISLQGLWLGVYLMTIQGYSSIQAGNMLIIMAIGNALGAPISGRISDKLIPSRKKMVLFGLGVYTLLLLILTLTPHFRHPLWYGTIYFFIGFFNGFGTLLYSHVKELFPLSMSATTMAWVNFFTMSGGAIIMSLMGKIIESLSRAGVAPVVGYRITFLICFLSMVASLIYYAFSKTGDKYHK